MRAWWIVVALAAAPAMAVEPAQQFDLVCTAKKTVVRYRINLDRGEWCFDQCSRVMKIQQVTSGTITLAEEKPSPPNDITSYNRINRLTGEWGWYYSNPRYAGSMNHRGLCEPAAFSGFGDINRKF